MINVIFSSIACAYFLRKVTIEDLCGLYISETMNAQWTETMNMLSSGELILANTSPLSVLYYNSAFMELMKKFNKRDDNAIDDDVTEVVDGLIIKGINAKRDNGTVEIRKKFTDYINQSAEEELKEYKYFIDHEELVVEVKINKLIFNGKEANIISFIDCSSARELEKTQIECKYKTILISSISHELRSPVNYILNALDLVSSFLPNNSMSLLEMSKECCNMIVAHINDLTVSLHTR